MYYYNWSLSSEREIRSLFENEAGNAGGVEFEKKLRRDPQAYRRNIQVMFHAHALSHAYCAIPFTLETLMLHSRIVKASR